MKKTLSASIAAGVVVGLTGCAYLEEHKGAATGAAIGTAAGAAVGYGVGGEGNKGTSTAIGAAVGGAAGAAAGHYGYDKKKQEEQKK